LLGLFQTARRFNMEVQPQLVLLQKTLLNIEGLGRQLYPDLDLWKTGKPFLENWMKNRMGAKALYRTVREQAPDWLDKLPYMPQLVFDALLQIKRMDSHQRAQQQALSRSQDVAAKRRRRSRAFGVLLLLLALLVGESEIQSWLQQFSAAGWAMAAAGLYLLLMH